MIGEGDPIQPRAPGSAYKLLQGDEAIGGVVGVYVQVEAEDHRSASYSSRVMSVPPRAIWEIGRLLASKLISTSTC